MSLRESEWEKKPSAWPWTKPARATRRGAGESAAREGAAIASRAKEKRTLKNCKRIGRSILCMQSPILPPNFEAADTEKILGDDSTGAAGSKVRIASTFERNPGSRNIRV